MKKVYYILVAAILLAFTSCKKYDDDINRINNRLNRIEGTTISNIDKQITAINGSLANLSDVDAALQKQWPTSPPRATNLVMNLKTTLLPTLLQRQHSKKRYPTLTH